MERRIFLMFCLMAFSAIAADDLSGKWNMSMETPGGERKATPTLVLQGESVSGKWDSSNVKGTFREGRLELEFPLQSSEAGYQAVFKVSAKLAGTQLKGSWSWAEYGGLLTGAKLP